MMIWKPSGTAALPRTASTSTPIWAGGVAGRRGGSASGGGGGEPTLRRLTLTHPPIHTPIHTSACIHSKSPTHLGLLEVGLARQPQQEVEVCQAGPVGRRAPRPQVRLELRGPCRRGGEAQAGCGCGQERASARGNARARPGEPAAAALARQVDSCRVPKCQTRSSSTNTCKRGQAAPCGSSRFSTANLASTGPSWSLTATGTKK